LLGLKWDNVDLERAVLHVQRMLSAAKSDPTFNYSQKWEGAEHQAHWAGYGRTQAAQGGTERGTA
jgi:hypothetical protein